MECLEAQRIISEVLDRSPVPAEELQEAKKHCAGCADCLGYLRTLTALQKTPAPQPPDDLADRVMRRIEREAEVVASERALAEAAAAAATVGGGAATKRAPTEPVNVRSLWERALHPENRRNLVIWAGAAAGLLLFVGILAASGMNSILQSGGTASRQARSDSKAAGDAATIVPPTAVPEAAAPGYGETDESATGAATAGAPQKYISAGGFAYRLVGENTFAESNLTKAGTIASGLDTGGPPQSFDYYTTPQKGQVVVAGADGAKLLFEQVVRDFAGDRYALRSGDIATFGEWPTMPGGQAPPSNPDGSPEYLPAGTSQGVTVYIAAGTTAQAGIAVPTGTPATDPAAGNPNWTWWTPLAR